jgi:DNA-directed RNA polymerase subunit H
MVEYEFNVMTHKLVPEHYLLSPEEEKKVLESLKIDKESLPKIRKNDPCILVLEALHGEIEEGRVIKIVRESRTAGRAIAYRVVTKV